MNQNALYYQYPYVREFEAEVTGCEAAAETEQKRFPGQTAVWRVTLSADGFYPEGGGQPGDRGWIGAAGSSAEDIIRGKAEAVHVLDVQEGNAGGFHYTDGPLVPGQRVTCVIDWKWRMRNTQNHSGEHIISGLVHRDFGYDNVGFHMHMEEEQPLITIDFNGLISWEELLRIEAEANEIVRRDLPVEVFYPSAAELAVTEYRSKKALQGTVRLVRIPETDLCACCGTHVERTGEIGCIKLLSVMNHRGGVRIEMLCGRDAFRDYQEKHDALLEISRALSAKPEEAVAAVRRLMEENQRKQRQIAELNARAFRQKAAEYARIFGPAEPDAAKAVENAVSAAEGAVSDRLTACGVLCDFEADMKGVELRQCCDYLMKHTGARIAAVFGEGGSYVLGSRTEDVRPVGKALNARLSGRGGGQAAMVQGSLSGTEAEIRAALTEVFS